MKLCMKNPFVLVYAEKQAQDGEIQTLEGLASYKTGDFILTGIANEKWPLKPDKNNENIPNCYSAVLDSKNIFYPSGFVFKSYEFAKQEGTISLMWDLTNQTILKYAVGDALIMHCENDTGPCNRVIFDKTYIVGDSKEEILKKLLSLSNEDIQKLNEKIIKNNPNTVKPVNLRWKTEQINCLKDNINNRLQEILKQEYNNSVTDMKVKSSTSYISK